MTGDGYTTPLEQLIEELGDVAAKLLNETAGDDPVFADAVRRTEAALNQYLIWSNEHGAWWGPGEFGYPQDIVQAGRYTKDRAAEIVARANIVPGPHAEPNEVMVVAPEHRWHGRSS